MTKMFEEFLVSYFEINYRSIPSFKKTFVIILMVSNMHYFNIIFLEIKLNILLLVWKSYLATKSVWLALRSSLHRDILWMIRRGSCRTKENTSGKTQNYPWDCRNFFIMLVIVMALHHFRVDQLLGYSDKTGILYSKQFVSNLKKIGYSKLHVVALSHHWKYRIKKQ